MTFQFWNNFCPSKLERGHHSWIFIGRTDAEVKLQYFDHLNMKNWLIGKDPDAGKDWRQEEKGMTEDVMAGWHHWLNGHEFGKAPGIGDGQGGLVCCSPWGSQRVGHDRVTKLKWSLSWMVPRFLYRSTEWWENTYLPNFWIQLIINPYYVT